MFSISRVFRRSVSFNLIAISLMVLAMLPFLQALHFGVLNFDDYVYLFKKQLWNGDLFCLLSYCFGSCDDAIWMPLTRLSYALDFSLFGDWYGGFHFHSIFLHFLNSLLVWRLLLKTFKGEKWMSLVGALFWAVHPLRCESVVLLSSRKDVVSFLFEFLALNMWLKGNWRMTIASYVCFVLGSMGKPSVMTFPVLCLLLDWLVVRKVLLWRYVFPIIYAIFLAVFSTIQQGAGGAMVDFAGLPFWCRICDACAAFGVYLKNFLWPVKLAIPCIKRWPDWPMFLMPGIMICIAWCGIIIRHVVCHWKHRNKLFKISRSNDLLVSVSYEGQPSVVLVGMLWFSVAVFPMLGLIGFGYHAFADRFTYIPSIGLSLIVIEAIRRLNGWLKGWGIHIAIMFWIACLFALTWRQVGFFKDDHALFERALSVDGDTNYLAHTSLAQWYFEFPHDLEKCVAHYEQAMQRGIVNVSGTYEVYFFALCELGRPNDELRRKFNAICDYYVECYGIDAMCGSLMGFMGDDVKRARATERYMKTAWQITSADCWSAAEETLTSLPSSQDNDPYWLYLKYRLAVMKGDVEQQHHIKARLSARRRFSGYVHFRYIQ